MRLGLVLAMMCVLAAFAGSAGAWHWQPAAYELAAFYRARLQGAGRPPNAAGN